MKQVVDSNEEQLAGPVIIAMSVEQLHQQENIPKEALMLAIAKETTMDNTDVVQIGNTVFITHTQEQKGNLYAVGRAFNVDTARNFLNSVLEFAKYGQGKGVKQYVTYYRGGIYDSLFRAFERIVEKQGTDVKIIPQEGVDETWVVVTFGAEPLK